MTLREEGVSILLVEQNVDVALDLCSRAAVLAERRIVADGVLADLVGTTTFAEAMFGRVEAPPTVAMHGTSDHTRRF
jgi:branched-chain amino acid transport system ATP-binding protein